jgi:hypothetical protein
MKLYTMTLTEKEVGYLRNEALEHDPYWEKTLLERSQDNCNGISDASRKLILEAAEANGKVDFHSPDWWIMIQPCGMEDAGGFREPGWSGIGSLSYDDMPGHTVRNVRGDTPESVLDAILDFHGCGPNRSLPLDLGDE